MPLKHCVQNNEFFSTDPPYYDNIGYADLSDFFYVWLRHSVGPIYPSIFATLAVPKSEELVATPHRHGSKKEAEQFFLKGMSRAVSHLAEQAHGAFPVSIYYAFKQSERKGESGIGEHWVGDFPGCSDRFGIFHHRNVADADRA